MAGKKHAVARKPNYAKRRDGKITEALALKRIERHGRRCAHLQRIHEIREELIAKCKNIINCSYIQLKKQFGTLSTARLNSIANNKYHHATWYLNRLRKW